MTYILAITTVATLDDAKQLAHILVQEKLCACVNILSKCCSIYSWQGNIEETEEHILLIKTLSDAYVNLEAKIQEIHKYDIPEIITIDITNGLPSYLNWFSLAMQN